MLKLLKRWLGWESDSGLYAFEDLEVAARRRSRVVAHPPKAPSKQPMARRAAPQARQQPNAQRPAAKAKKSPGAARAAKKTKKTAAEILHNPLLALDRPTEDGFDPYNTGAFNRSASWESIGRRKR